VGDELCTADQLYAWAQVHGCLLWEAGSCASGPEWHIPCVFAAYGEAVVRCTRSFKSKLDWFPNDLRAVLR
jgi:hypothetical protein